MEEHAPNITNSAVGDPRSTASTVLETGAAATQVQLAPPTANDPTKQDFGPLKSMCAFGIYVVPMGAPELMMSFTSEEQWKAKKHLVEEQDERFMTDVGRKREIGKGIEEPGVEADANQLWRKGRDGNY
ncbi:hypothetical protein MMC11_004225 [Xylographa trunciseda]|nr:hypothetical protein [Xylographa trunciseda]